MTTQKKRLFLVDGLRTPFLRVTQPIGPLTPASLATLAAKMLLLQSSIPKSAIDECIVGTVMPLPTEANIARIIGLRLGLADSVPAFTVQRNCASGLQAIDSACLSILQGRSEIVLCGGTEAMSYAPLYYPPSFVKKMAAFQAAKNMIEKTKALLQIRPADFCPQVALKMGLKDHVVGLNMGQTAEILAQQFNISREDMDRFSIESHRRASMAKECLAEEITPIYEKKAMYQNDTGIRDPIDMAKVSKLKPVFESIYGRVTAGNSSQISDGAAMLLVASEKAVAQWKLEPLAEIIDICWSGLDPKRMGLGPAYAIAQLLQKNKHSLAQIDRFEINEAFSAQVLAVQKALADNHFCKTELGLKSALGEIPSEQCNMEGGAVAIGHPVGASGARLSLHLAKMLHQQNQQYGIASLCIGGGQGGAILLKGLAGGI